MMPKSINTLFDYLVCPISKTNLTADIDNKTLENENGYKYHIINSIPVMLSDTKSETEENYRRHYTKDAELFDYFEERSGGTEHDERRVREYILSKIPSTAETILDVGCGRAWIAKELIKRKKFICSLDISLTNLEKALELYPSVHHAAVVADAVHLPFADNTFDCIVSSEVIEHVTKPGEFIEELFRCVKPGGRLIITTPYKEEIRQTLCIHCNQATPLNAHLHSFDENSLRELYTKEDLGSFFWKAFGNKALMHLRLHVILKYFPFWLWKLKDNAANLIMNKRAHILAIYTKK